MPARMTRPSARIPRAALDRRLRLRRRRGHPGRPEGLRPLRRARDDRDHGDHGAEHRRRSARVYPLPPEAIVEQVRAVAEDIGVDAVKIGMLGTVETIEAVGEALDCSAACPVVLDPVMVAESGAALLDDERARRAARAARCRARPSSRRTCPRRRRSPDGPAEDADAEELARAVHALGPGLVVVTGGHREEATDVFFDGERLEEIPGERHPDGAAHGSGCTHSSALAAHLALGARPARGRRRGEARSPPRRSATACAGIGAGRGPGGRARARATPSTPITRSASRDQVA